MMVNAILVPHSNDVLNALQERLPCPYGLVRSGVAPDHPETKVCSFTLFDSSWLLSAKRM